jgi:putative toxin-antitoxin system antitoxin component (TIGR02293 family)
MAITENSLMTRTEQILNLWGTPVANEQLIQSPHDLIPLLRRGLPYTALERTLEAFQLSREEISAVLDLPLRTLARRKQSQRLAAGESDRLYRLTRILAHAEQALGTREQAVQWLHRSNPALNHEIPLHLLDTDIGAEQVDQVLGRLEHGVFS